MVSKKLAILLCLILLCPLITLAWTNSSKVSASMMPLLPDELFKESNSTDETVGTTGISDEICKAEGANPVYVLVFGDEEERDVSYICKFGWLMGWKDYAGLQIERGDKALARDFGIDLRILDFLGWDSDDNKDTLSDLIVDLKEKTKHYIGTLYVGKYWWGYVDAIIGITTQYVTDSAGRAYLGGNFAIIKWQTSFFFDLSWADDNIVKHEVSHWFEAEDHKDGCCLMATGHEHFQSIISEDGYYWLICENVVCGYTSNSWCTTCHNTIWSNRQKFSPTDYPSDGGRVSSGRGGVEIPIDMESLNIPPLRLYVLPTLVFVILVACGILILLRRVLRLWKQKKLA